MHFLSAESKLDLDSTVWESKALASPHPPSSSLSPQFRAASGQLQRIHFKGFWQTQNSQAEVGVSSFGRVSGASASQGALFSFPVIRSSCFHGGHGGYIHPSLELCSRRGSTCERQIPPALAEQRSLKFSCGERFHISSPPPLNAGLAYNWSSRFNPALKGSTFSVTAILLQLFWFLLDPQRSGSSFQLPEILLLSNFL